VVVGDGKISTQGLRFFYPEQGSAEFWKNILIQGLRFLQLQHA